ncbi:MAG TPA: glycosyltransferase family 2 protein [Pyrinomonadaceae bacterium]|nr:glycosyltransferase family 2 protein [Pyrinomonadaceae bacterium]
MQISATIITFNEEEKIADAIKSVAFADEILVVDSESTDKTREIAESLGAKIIIQKWLGFGKQKQFAVEAATHDWILSLDADERISDELKQEIINLSPKADAFKIPRLTFYLNRPVKHGGWYPDWQIRFFNRNKASWKDVLIHESVEVAGKTDKLKGDILHYSVEDMGHHHRMIGERYAPLAARQMFERGRRTTKLKIYTAGFIAFLQTYILKAGFLDGFAGFCIACFAAHHAFLKHLLLWEMQKK